jgi:ankyrin repeat protein
MASLSSTAIALLLAFITGGTALATTYAPIPWSKEPALHKAARSNDVESLESLIRAGHKPSERWAPTDTNALEVAAATGKAQAVEYLLKRGMNPRNRRKDGTSALELAAMHSQRTVLEHFSESSPALDEWSLDNLLRFSLTGPQSRQHYVMLPEPWTKQDHHYVIRRRDTVTFLISAGASPERIPDAVRVATATRDLEILRLVVDHGADVSAVTKDGILLWHGVLSCDPNFLRYVLELGVNPNSRLSDNYAGYALILATDDYLTGNASDCKQRSGWPAIIDLLLDFGADPNVRRPQLGYTPLMQMRYGPRNIAERLLAKGAQKDLRSARGETALDMARAAGNHGLVQLLSGSNINR